jgi:hypothetical protein
LRPALRAADEIFAFARPTRAPTRDLADDVRDDLPSSMSFIIERDDDDLPMLPMLRFPLGMKSS